MESLLKVDLEEDATVSLLGAGTTLAVSTDSRDRAVLPTGRLIAGKSNELNAPLVFKVAGVK